MKIDAFARRLDHAGLNLLTVLDKSTISALADGGTDEMSEWGAIILIGNSGATMWQRMPDEYHEREHPVDEYAQDTTAAALRELLPDTDWQVLFPAPVASVYCPPLQQFGALAGWHHSSPLGTGINNLFGLWFAYRVVIGVSPELPSCGILDTRSPCLTCTNQPCVQTCPATALSYQRQPDMKSCATFRMQMQSPCADTCLARLACPIAADSKYHDEQIAHHYLRSVTGLESWLAVLADN